MSRFYAYLRRSRSLCLVKVTYGGADFMRIYAGLAIFAHLRDLSLKSSAQRGGPRGASQRGEPKEVSLERFAK